MTISFVERQERRPILHNLLRIVEVLDVRPVGASPAGDGCCEAEHGRLNLIPLPISDFADVHTRPRPLFTAA